MAVGRIDPERFARLVTAHSALDNDPASSLCLACVDVLGVSGAGLTMMSGGRSLGCVGVSDPVAEAVEQVEFTVGEGPCVAAYTNKAPVFDPDLADPKTVRWPEFRRGALAAGIRAAFGFPLLVDRVCIGAMNLYHHQAGALTEAQVDDALVVAKLTSKTLLTWQAEAAPGTVAWQLETVPNHRMEVHQATGRISVQAGIRVADALVLLRAFAFAEDLSISAVATAVSNGQLRFD